MKQIQIDFQPGTTDSFSGLMEAVRHVVYGGGMKHTDIASAMDRAPSKLTRQMGTELKFSVEDLEELLTVTGNFTPIYYLIEKFLQSGGVSLSNEAALKKVGSLAAQLQREMAKLKIGDSKSHVGSEN